MSCLGVKRCLGVNHLLLLLLNNFVGPFQLFCLSCCKVLKLFEGRHLGCCICCRKQDAGCRMAVVVYFNWNGADVVLSSERMILLRMWSERVTRNMRMHVLSTCY